MPAPPGFLQRWLADGAPTPLPHALDAASEWWVARPPRQRRALAVAVLVVVVLHRAVSGADGTAPVLVATRDLPASHVLGSDDLSLQLWPADLRPPAALSGDPGDLAGRRLGSPVARGVPVVASVLAAGSPADLAPDGFVALAVEADLLPDLAVGVVLDLHGGDGTSVTGALLLGVRDSTAWLGVPRAQAGNLSQALAWGPVHVAVVPQRRGPPTTSTPDEDPQPAT